MVSDNGPLRYLIETKNWPNFGPNQVRGRRAKAMPENGEFLSLVRVRNRASRDHNQIGKIEKMGNMVNWGNREIDKIGKGRK